MFISDKVSSMTKLQPNTVIRAALDLLNEVGVDGLTTRKLAERLGGSAAGALLALQEQAGAARRTGRSHAGGESYAFGAESRRRLALISDRECPQLQAGAARLPRWRAHPCRHATGRTADGNGRRAASLPLRGGFSAGDAVNALMTISYFTVGAVLEEQAGGTVEQAPLSPLLRAAIDAFDEAGPDAAFEQGLAVIVDGLAKRRLVVRNVEGPRKGDD